MQAGTRDGRTRTLGARLRTLVGRSLALLIAVDAAIVLWIWLVGPPQVNARALPRMLLWINPLYLLPLLILAWGSVHWRSWRSWFGLAGVAQLRLGGPNPLAWLAMLASIALLGAQTLTVVWSVLPIPQKVQKSARAFPGSMSVNGANRHVPSLVRTLVQRESSEPPAVWIDDLDSRGHTASFYLYPRLMLMEPKLRRWSLRQHMTFDVMHDPLFSIGHRPPRALSQAFADARDTQLVFAVRPGGAGLEEPE